MLRVDVNLTKLKVSRGEDSEGEYEEFVFSSQPYGKCRNLKFVAPHELANEFCSERQRVNI
jgi:hypothetical protein